MDHDDLLRALLHMHILQDQLVRDRSAVQQLKSSKQRLSQDYVLVAAFDFGTTFSGYAFSFKENKGTILMNKNWGANLGFASYKTSTSVLVKPDKTFHSFGFEAQKTYAEMDSDDAHAYYYFERFKMALHNNRGLSKETQITAANGKAFPALNIIAFSLRYLKDHLLQALEKQSATKPELHHIRWVLTVPAIWSDASKQFMREAAKMAGLTTDVDANNLLIALEPEAASLYCRTLNPEKFTVSEKKIEIEAGTKYLVLDAGGGTLDVTAHQVQSDGSVKELHYATGGALGGTRVDEEFVDLLNDIFGKPFVRSYKKDCASNWLALMTEFDNKKRSLKASEASTLNISLNYSMATKFQELTKKSVETVFKPCPVAGVSFSNGVIVMSHDRAKQLFDPVLKGIVEHIKKLLQNPSLNGIKYFFLVGGFAESGLLQAKILDNFKQKYRILVPEEASLAVVKGAVMFGHNPSAIQSRIAARTYGIKQCPAFVEGEHDERKSLVVDGKKRCQDVFEPFVEMGEELPDGFCKSMQFRPVRAAQTAAEVSVYSADEKTVQYIDEPSVKHNANIEVTWPGSGLERELDITMTFGGTEIHVDAVARPGGDSASTTVNFLVQE